MARPHPYERFRRRRPRPAEPRMAHAPEPRAAPDTPGELITLDRDRAFVLYMARGGQNARWSNAVERGQLREDVLHRGIENRIEATIRGMETPRDWLERPVCIFFPPRRQTIRPERDNSEDNNEDNAVKHNPDKSDVKDKVATARRTMQRTVPHPDDNRYAFRAVYHTAPPVITPRSLDSPEVERGFPTWSIRRRHLSRRSSNLRSSITVVYYRVHDGDDNDDVQHGEEAADDGIAVAGPIQAIADSDGCAGTEAKQQGETHPLDTSTDSAIASLPTSPVSSSAAVSRFKSSIV